MQHLQPAVAANFTELSCQEEFSDWTAFQGRSQNDVPCRVVVFSAELSANEYFRSSWRRDTTLIQLIPHDGVPAIVESRDEEGIVYVATEALPGVSLAEYLAEEQLGWDEIADVGWQIASAVQHLHNGGIAHGGLSIQQVRINEQLRIHLLDSGIRHWIANARTEDGKADSMSQLYTQDFTALGQLLSQLAHSDTQQHTEPADIPGAWWSLIEDLSDDQSDRFPSTAREVQGRLGGILLDDSGESMDVVADRTGQSSRRNSIVDQLLPESPDAPPNAMLPKQHRRRRMLPGVVLIIAVVVVVAVVILLRK